MRANLIRKSKNNLEVISMSNILERFMKYIAIDTQSDEDSTDSPSTAKQFRLAKLLAEEMAGMGVSNVRLDDQHCYVYGEIPSNLDADIPALGFISHMDTSPNAPGDAGNARGEFAAEIEVRARNPHDAGEHRVLES